MWAFLCCPHFYPVEPEVKAQGSELLRLMEPSSSCLWVLSLLSPGPVLLRDWHLVWQRATALAVQPLTCKGPGCLPISLADKASDGGQTVPGSRSQRRSDSPSGLCLCHIPSLAVARSRLLSNRQTPVSLTMVSALLKRVFQATKGLVFPVPVGSS